MMILYSDCDPEKQVAQLQAISEIASKLKPREKRLLALRYVHGQSFSKIGEILGISAGRANQIHHKCIRVMRVRSKYLGYLIEIKRNRKNHYFFDTKYELNERAHELLG